jgi:hypothetical protein
LSESEAKKVEEGKKVICEERTGNNNFWERSFYKSFEHPYAAHLNAKI